MGVTMMTRMAVVRWFNSQYDNTLKIDFNRGELDGE